jgi:N-acetylglucosamine-6-sulfatase
MQEGSLLGKAEKGRGDLRRMVLVFAAMAIIGLVLPADGLLTDTQRADAQTASRPNIVFVMADDLDERSMQDLPGIRQVMGSNGITFENAYVTYSLCCPSRATILRGQYPHNHGIIGNAPPEGGEPKFRQLGLVHQLLPQDVPPALASMLKPLLISIPGALEAEALLELGYDLRERRGVEHLGDDQSTIATWLDDAGYRTKLIGKYMNSYTDLYVPPGWDEWFALKQGSGTYRNVNEDGHWITLGGHSAYVFADKASDFIRRSSASPDPFFVMVNSVAPHGPPEVAPQYKDQFATTPLPRPLNFDEADVSDKPQWVKYFPQLTQAQIDQEQNLYRKRLRSMLSVEDLLKQIIATLQETGELDNTYIFFTSDNGYHIGNHRLGMNKNTPYEEDIGVPLMVRGPGVPAGSVRQELVLNNDFAPTIADLAGASTPAFVDGSSFVPLLSASPPYSWRTAFLEEGWLEGGTKKVPTPTHKSVHTQKYMFTEYDIGEHELYDLIVDPYQLESKPRAGNEQLYADLAARLSSLRDCSGDGCRTAEWAATTPTDTTASAFISTVPKANATGVAPKANVKATFSEDMMTSINGNTFKLFKKGSTTQKIAAAVSYDAGTDTATLDPTNTLQRGVNYKAVVSTGTKDLAGNQLDQNSTTTGSQQMAWFFTVSN